MRRPTGWELPRGWGLVEPSKCQVPGLQSSIGVSRQVATVRLFRVESNRVWGKRVPIDPTDPLAQFCRTAKTAGFSGYSPTHISPSSHVVTLGKSPWSMSKISVDSTKPIEHFRIPRPCQQFPAQSVAISAPRLPVRKPSVQDSFPSTKKAL